MFEQRDLLPNVFMFVDLCQRSASKATTVHFQRADFGLFRMLVERVP